MVKSLDDETAQVAKALHSKGYAVIDFPDPTFEEKIEGLKRDFSEYFNWTEWKSGIISDLRIQDAWKFDDRVKEIASNKKIINLLTNLYGRPAFPFQTLNFPVGTQQAAHSDHVHFNSIPDRFMCGVWVAMEDVDDDNGPLFYYPGSNKWPSYGNEHIGVSHRQINGPYAEYQKFIDLWEELANYQGIKREKFYAKKGQALIWSSNLVHGGSIQTNKNRTRWSQVTHYFFENCGYTTPVDNDVYAGKIFFRKVVNCATGGLVNSVISGLELSREQIDRMRPDHIRPTNWTIARRRLSRFRKHPGIPEGFDPVRYLALNGDVEASGADPYEHYVDYGKKEGRRW